MKLRPGEGAVTAKATANAKCIRCWHYRADVGANPEHPEICSALRRQRRWRRRRPAVVLMKRPGKVLVLLSAGLVLLAAAGSVCHWMLLRHTSLLGPPLSIVERTFEQAHPGAEVLALWSTDDPGECAYEVTIVFGIRAQLEGGTFEVRQCWESNDEAGDNWMANGESKPLRRSDNAGEAEG